MRFVIRDPKKGSSGSSGTAPARSGPRTQYVVGHSANDATRCCVYSLPRDPARSSRKQCSGYFLTVVHFRKLRNNRKVGSCRNGHPVI